MERESSYESDISESWSLIDVNTEEESLPVTETPELEKAPAEELKNVESRRRSDLEVKDFLEKSKQIYKTDLGLSCNSDSNSSLVAEGFVSCSYKESEGMHLQWKRGVQDDVQNDSDDIESIEVLDLDGNYRESEIDRPDSATDSHDSQTYQSDDEESLEENISNSSTLIKRRRRKFCSNEEGIVNSVNSEKRSPGECGLKACSSEGEKNNEEPGEKSCRGSSRPVCKHYRNNVANTVLSLSVGVIFAGVTCIAICHFLGVQNGAKTAGELVETLKKLQMENAALQSRLHHLNRVLVSRESKSKLGLVSEGAPCKEGVKVGTSKGPEGGDLSGAALSEISSSLNSIEWLSKLENLVRNDDKRSENGMDFGGFGKYIQEQLNFLRTGKEEGAKILEGADRKIFKVLQKIVTRLSMSQDKIENLYQKLVNLKNKLNDKLNKILPDAPEEIGGLKSKFLRKVAVTELDLQTAQWDSEEKVAEDSLQDCREFISVYPLPQPEKYYRVEVRSLESAGEKALGERNANETLEKGVGEKVEETGKKDNKIKKCESERRKQKKRGRVNRKKESWNERELEGGSKEKKQKRSGKKLVAKQTERGKRKKGRVFGSEAAKAALSPSISELGSIAEAEVIKPKKLKRKKKWKLKKCSPSKLRKDSYGGKKDNRVCSVHECFNSTGFWMFKWADGRDDFRRRQALGDWQFDRAKGREELRDDDYRVNWQLKRALGRESSRYGGC